MNHSRYNVSAPASAGGHLLYNTANGAFALLDDQAWQAYEAGEAGAADERLAALGFLTELSPAEELAALQERLAWWRSCEDTLRISLLPTYACNYKCPYCYEEFRSAIKGKMGASVMDAVMEFIAAQFAQRAESGLHAFRNLSVQWYGGDPSLALDVVEALSARMIAWCEGRGYGYDALMLTNANVIDEEEAQLISDCRISEVYLTIDGPEEVHNRRRVAANGTNSYQRTIHAARLLRERDVRLIGTMNVDRVTWPLFAETRDKLAAEEGIALTAGRLCDYAHSYGTGDYALPAFDLFEHDEFCRASLEQFASEPHTAAEMRSMLQPNRRFCSGQSGAYFVIDCKGDVYHCDGWVGDRSFVRFNLLDGPDAWKPSEITFDATRDAKCSQCEQLPMCLGSCIWERTLTGMPCYPMKDTIDGYLRIYGDCFGNVQPDEGGLAVLAEPLQEIDGIRFGGADM